ncbi:MAG TPA: hypothetical protein VL360_08180 [Gammaproteobacteria bacterium]|jgi:hypothetical protein|nr:hypothetical protein [Gammaproteobacteria bacterium]
MAGQVTELPVWDTISTAWEKTYGAKATFWGAILILAAIMFGIGVLEGISSQSSVISGLFQVIGNILGYFLQLGIIYIGITRAKDLPINYKMMFTTFDLMLALRLIGLYILQTLIFLIPIAIGAIGVYIYMMGSSSTTFIGGLIFLISVIIGIVIAIRLSLSMAFILDTREGPVAAIKHSLAATNHNFWNLVGIYLLQVIIIIVSIIPLGIGLIWSIPFVLINYGMIYKILRVNT